MENEKNILFYCSYCKDPIYEGKPYVTEGEDYYHPDCYNQMNTYDDTFGSDESE